MTKEILRFFQRGDHAFFQLSNPVSNGVTKPRVLGKTQRWIIATSDDRFPQGNGTPAISGKYRLVEYYSISPPEKLPFHPIGSRIVFQSHHFSEAKMWNFWALGVFLLKSNCYPPWNGQPACTWRWIFGMMDPFLLGFGLFSGAKWLLVSGSVYRSRRCPNIFWGGTVFLVVYVCSFLWFLLSKVPPFCFSFRHFF